MTWPTRRALSVWWRNLESWKRFTLSFVAASIGQPVFYLLAMGYGLGRYVAPIDGVPYAVFLTPGIIASAAMNTASFETTFGSFTRMTEQNTYAAILATPCTVADIVGGDVLWAASKSVLSAGAVLLMTALAGLVPSPLALLLLPVAFLTGLLFAALGMIATSRAGSYDFFNYYFTFAISVMMFVSGVFFPADSLPAPARAFAWFLPLTHAVAICRALTGGGAAGVVGHVVWMVVATALAFVVAERLIRRRLLV